jgi:hypothetical protein
MSCSDLYHFFGFQILSILHLEYFSQKVNALILFTHTMYILAGLSIPFTLVVYFLDVVSILPRCLSGYPSLLPLVVYLSLLP